MLQNEGLDEKTKQYATCALDSKSPKEGEGGGGLRVGYVLAVSPSVTFLKVYFRRPNKFLVLFMIPGKPC